METKIKKNDRECTDSRCINNKDERLNSSFVASNGMKMTIIKYTRCDDITVEFEDGAIVEHQAYKRILKGLVRHPSVKPISKKLINNKDERLNSSFVASNGMKMTIIKYIKSNDITVEFEDGVIVEHQTYKRILKGLVRYPEKYNRLGEISTASNGMKIKIIKYITSGDITVEFDDKTVLTHMSYSNFITKKIGYPRGPIVGDSSIAINGMKMTVIKCDTRCDISVQFEDGVIVEHKYYGNFINGHIAHPNRPTKITDFPRIIGCMNVTGIAYWSKNPNLFCECVNCHEKFIMTYDEMKNHICKK